MIKIKLQCSISHKKMLQLKIQKIVFENKFNLTNDVDLQSSISTLNFNISKTKYNLLDKFLIY